MKDYYYILGVTKESSLIEVKQAYRKLSNKFHPDKNNGDVYFENRFKEVLAAYEHIVKEMQTAAINDLKIEVPKILKFESNKYVVDNGDEIELKWITENTDLVFLSILTHNFKPIDNKRIKIKNFKESKELLITLTAKNKNQSISQELRIRQKPKISKKSIIKSKLNSGKFLTKSIFFSIFIYFALFFKNSLYDSFLSIFNIKNDVIQQIYDDNDLKKKGEFSQFVNDMQNNRVQKAVYDKYWNEDDFSSFQKRIVELNSLHKYKKYKFSPNKKNDLKTYDDPWDYCIESINDCYKYCSQIKVSSSKYSDVVISIKKSNEVIKNIFLAKNSTIQFPIRNGEYEVFFYSGNNWDNSYYMGESKCGNLFGGFRNDEMFQKDKVQELNSSMLTYILTQSEFGNFNAENINRKTFIK